MHRSDPCALLTGLGFDVPLISSEFQMPIKP